MFKHYDVSLETKIASAKAFLARYAEGEMGFSETDIPAVPEVELLENEVLVLGIYLPDKDSKPGYLRTFDAWWDFYELPEFMKEDGYKKIRSNCFQRNCLEAREDQIRLWPSYEYRPGMRWIVIDTKVYKGESSDNAVRLAAADGKTLAGLEVLMLLAYCPKWAASWGDAKPRINATALQVFYEKDGWGWSVLMYRWDGGSEVIMTPTQNTDYGFYRLSTHKVHPCFREC